MSESKRPSRLAVIASVVFVIAAAALLYWLLRQPESRGPVLVIHGGAGKVERLGERDVQDPRDEDEVFDREWVKHLLRLALERLADENPGYHRAVKLILFEGKSYAEACAATGQPQSTLKNLVHRGKLRLSELLREEVKDYARSKDEVSEELRALSRHAKL